MQKSIRRNCTLYACTLQRTQTVAPVSRNQTVTHTCTRTHRRTGAHVCVCTHAQARTRPHAAHSHAWHVAGRIYVQLAAHALPPQRSSARRCVARRAARDDGRAHPVSPRWPPRCARHGVKLPRTRPLAVGVEPRRPAWRLWFVCASPSAPCAYE